MISTKIPVMSSIMTVMTRAVLKASKGLLRDFTELEHLQVSKKSNNEFVTNADIASDRTLKQDLLKARPGFGWISEESEEIIGDVNYRWIVDPLDGTVNFMHGFPNWAISIALENTDTHEILAGVTYDPVKNEMFMGEKGKGVFMNDMRLRVSGKKSFADALCAIRTIDSNETRLASSVMTVRKIGSTTLNFAYTASGRYDVFLPGEKSEINIWDYAAGTLFIKEAGGVMADKNGKITNYFDKVNVITNIDFLPSIVNLLYK